MTATEALAGFGLGLCGIIMVFVLLFGAIEIIGGWLEMRDKRKRFKADRI